jgi:hypothetical protein
MDKILSFDQSQSLANCSALPDVRDILKRA